MVNRIKIGLITILLMTVVTAIPALAEPLDEWHTPDSLAEGIYLSGVIYGNNTYVAVGGNGTILTSADGVNWTSNTLEASQFLHSVTYGNNTFVAVGESGTILTSGDGINWTSRNSGIPGWLIRVTYVNNNFIAVGEDGTILTSLDGITWTGHTSGTSEMLRSVAYGNNTFVAVGYNDTIVTSGDGINWTRSTSGTSSWLEGVAYGNNTFVAVGSSGTVITSADGVNWTPQASGTWLSLNSVAYGNNTCVAVGENGTVLTSEDGINWTSRSSGVSGWLAGVAYSDNTFILVGEGGTILQSGSLIALTDTEPPTGSIAINDGAESTTSADVTLNISATDTGSGVAQMIIANSPDFSGAVWEDYAPAKAWTLAAGDGSKTIYIKFKDNAGNISTVYEDSISLAVPAVTFTSADIKGKWKFNVFFISNPDSVIGEYDTNGNQTTTWGRLPEQISITQTGQISAYSSWSSWGIGHTVILEGIMSNDKTKIEGTYRHWYNADGFPVELDPGSWSAVKVDGGNDTTPPMGSIAINDGAETATSANVSLNISATDTGTGVAQMMIANSSDFSGAVWEDYASAKAWTVTEGDGSKTVYIKFKDNAGNISTVYEHSISLVTVVDTLAPTVEAQPQGGTYNASQSITLTSSEPATIYYTTSGDEPTQQSPVYAGPIPINQNTTLKFMAIDTAGNHSPVSTESYTIQLTPVDPLVEWYVRSSGDINFLNGVTYVNNTFVAVGDGIFTSTDGVNWTKQVSGYFSGVTYGNNTFVAWNSGSIFTSSDGISWIQTHEGGAWLNSATYGNNNFVMFDEGVFMLNSADGLNWTSRSTPGNPGRYFEGSTYGNNTFVSVGDKILALTDDFSLKSLTHWVGLRGVTYGNNIFVAVGESGTILTSADGINWTSRTSGTSQMLNGITYGNNTFMAVGQDGIILTSVDGVNWTSRTSGTSNMLYGVTYGNNTFVAVGDGGIILQSGNLAGSVTLTKVSQPVWDGHIIQWLAIASAAAYEVKLFKDSTLVETQLIDPGVQNYDFGSTILAQGTGSYTVTVLARGDGVNFLDGTVSDVSAPFLKSLVGDISGPGGTPDGQINLYDLKSVAESYGTTGVANSNDLNKDGIVDVFDMVFVARRLH